MIQNTNSTESVGEVTIHILINIDADRIKGAYPQPSQDPNSPTGIDHTMAYMVASAPMRRIERNGTGDLIVYALVGDTVRAWATTPSRNLNNGVVLYGMPRTSGDEVLGPFVYERLTRPTVQPYSPNSPLPPHGEQPREESRDFYVYRSTVKNVGTEAYGVRIALYARDERMRHVLYGYFWWDPTFIVRKNDAG